MALDFQSFLGGMATTIVENEKMSAKLGLEEYKEALDDYREEAKNYAEEVDRDTKEYIELANVLTPLLKDPNKVTAVLDRGTAFTKLFIQKAEQVAERKGYDSVADLVRVSEAYEGIIDPIDWIRSGAPIDVVAPTYSGPKEMKTSVFRRDIGDGGKRAEGIESAYIRSRKGEPLTAPMAEIDIMAVEDLSGQKFKELSRTDAAGARATIMKTLADMAGVEADYYRDDSGVLQTKLTGTTADENARIRADADNVFQTWYGGAKAAKKAVDWANLEATAMSWAAGQYSPTDKFYSQAQKVISIARSGGQSTSANRSGATSVPQQQQQAQVPTNPASHPQIKMHMNNMAGNTRARRNNVVALLMQHYGMSKSDAETEAKRLIP